MPYTALRSASCSESDMPTVLVFLWPINGKGLVDAKNEMLMMTPAPDSLTWFSSRLLVRKFEQRLIATMLSKPLAFIFLTVVS